MTVKILGFPGELTTRLISLASRAGVHYEVVNPGTSDGSQFMIDLGITFLPAAVFYDSGGWVVAIRPGSAISNAEDFRNDE